MLMLRPLQNSNQVLLNALVICNFLVRQPPIVDSQTTMTNNLLNQNNIFNSPHKNQLLSFHINLFPIKHTILHSIKNPNHIVATI